MEQYVEASLNGGRMMKYVVIFERSSRNWSAYVPDLPGCVATGRTRRETEQLIRESIAFHLEGLTLKEMPIPPSVSTAANLWVQA